MTRIHCHPSIVCAVDDVQKEFERLTQKGWCLASSRPRRTGGVESVFEDTFGNLVQLVQMK